MGGRGNKKNYNVHKKIKSKTLHMNSELQKITTTWGSGKRVKRKILKKNVLQSFIPLRAHMHIHSSTHIPRTHGHRVFIVLYCIVLKKTSAKMNDHHKQDVTIISKT